VSSQESSRVVLRGLSIGSGKPVWRHLRYDLSTGELIYRSRLVTYEVFWALVHHPSLETNFVWTMHPENERWSREVIIIKWQSEQE
jgi:hypothetical protein